MNTQLTTSTAAAALASLAVPALTAAETGSVDDLIRKIKDKDDKIRGPAWQQAGPQSALAVQPLAGVMSDADFEIARAAKRALWNVVHYAGRPGADRERSAVSGELVALLRTAPAAVKRELLWMLSEIGGDESIEPIATCLADRDAREAARAALERIPGAKSLGALQAGLTTVAEEFKPALAHSLRVRGVTVAGYPSQKLVPTRPANGNADKPA